jgi:hypothetical protein
MTLVLRIDLLAWLWSCIANILMCDPIILLAKLFVIFGTFPGIRVSILLQVSPLSTVLNQLLIDVPIDLHDPVKPHVLSAKITLCLKVAATVTFSAGPPPTLDLQSLYSFNQMKKIVESLSSDSDKLSPAWVRLIKSLDIVASNARKISEVRKFPCHIWGARIDLNNNSFIYQSRWPWER